MSDERFTDWSPETVELVDDPTPAAPVVPHVPDNGSVVYEEGKVTAYFNALGKSVPPAHATYAKVWTPDGALKIVSLDQAAT